MSNSFTLLENASNSDPQEIASKTKEVKQDKPKLVEEKKPVQQARKPKAAAASADVVVEEGFQATRANVRGGRPQHQHHGHQAPKKGRAFDRHVSGTGVKKGDTKKQGGGKSNWGKPTDAKEEKPEQEQASEAVGETQPATEEKKVEETTPVEVVPVDTSITMEQYLNQKKNATKTVSLKKEAGEQLVTGKNVKLTETAFERPSDELFQKEKKVNTEKTEKKADKKPKTIAVSDFLDSASLEKIKEIRDKEYLEGPKQEREFRPRTGDRKPNTAGRGGNNNNRGERKPTTAGKDGKTATKSATGGQKKPRPVINKEKDFPALNPQN